MAKSSTSQYVKILQAHKVNMTKYWLVEVIENDCIVTWVGVYEPVLGQLYWTNIFLYCQFEDSAMTALKVH